MGSIMKSSEGAGQPLTPKKRVRFEETSRIRDIEALEKKRVRVQDPMEALEGKIEAVCLEGGTASTAASQRAQQRRAAVMSLFQDNDLDTLGDQDDADVDWDEEQVAEAGYEEPEERFNDAGIPFEPFHMREERAEGYFDRETGDYVRYQRQEEEDAWVDGLPDVDDVDREWLRRVLRGTRTNTGTSTAGASHDLTTQESTQLKQRIVDELEPGENVLQALQRLGKARTMPTAPLAEGPGTAMSAGKHRLMLSRQSSMSATAKAAFDQLTEASSLLMEAGEYNIHSISREQLATSIAAPGLLESTSVSDGSFGTATVLLEEAKRSSTDAGRGLQGGARLAASLLAGAEASARRDVDLALGGEHLGSKLGTLTDTEQPLEHHHERNGRPAGMEDAQVEDMFADEDPSPVDGHGQQVHGVACGGETTLHPPGESHITNGGGGEPRPNAAQHAQQEEHAWRARHGPGDGLQGFVLDASSGYLYNSSMGCYYDPATNLFGDAASGRWYRLDVATGQYILAG